MGAVRFLRCSLRQVGVGLRTPFRTQRFAHISWPAHSFAWDGLRHGDQRPTGQQVALKSPQTLRSQFYEKPFLTQASGEYRTISENIKTKFSLFRMNPLQPKVFGVKFSLREIERNFIINPLPPSDAVRKQEKNILEDLFTVHYCQFKKYHPSEDLKFNYLGIFQS